MQNDRHVPFFRRVLGLALARLPMGKAEGTLIVRQCLMSHCEFKGRNQGLELEKGYGRGREASSDNPAGRPVHPFHSQGMSARGKWKPTRGGIGEYRTNKRLVQERETPWLGPRKTRQ